MKFDKLCQAVEGLYAFDTGCVCSGIHDEDLKQEVYNHLLEIYQKDPKEFETEVTRVSFQLCLTPLARSLGYTEEDAVEISEWMNELILTR